MIKTIYLSIICFFILQTLAGQTEIQYGSNNGQYISIFDTKMYYEEYGEGTPVILLTGGFGAVYSFRMVIPSLSNHFRVIAVDSPGHGRSDQADTLSYQLITDYISEMIDLLKLDSVYILGCSDGAVVAVLLAYDKPEKVKRIVCDGLVTNFEGYYAFVRPWLEEMSPENRTKSWLERISNVPRNDDWEKFVWDMKKMWLEDPYVPDYKLKEIESRTLILMGDREAYIKLEHGIELFRTVQNSELCILPGLGHAISHINPYLMNDIVINFFTKE
jgi:pimeloyl-ACP methyl ester carboxylesterase